MLDYSRFFNHWQHGYIIHDYIIYNRRNGSETDRKICLFRDFFYVWKKIQKKYKTEEKKLAIWKNFYYTNKCCDMIAVKREVAALVAGFPWSECQVRKLTTSHCITSKGLTTNEWECVQI